MWAVRFPDMFLLFTLTFVMFGSVHASSSNEKHRKLCSWATGDEAKHFDDCIAKVVLLENAEESLAGKSDEMTSQEANNIIPQFKAVYELCNEYTICAYMGPLPGKKSHCQLPERDVETLCERTIKLYRGQLKEGHNKPIFIKRVKNETTLI